MISSLWGGAWLLAQIPSDADVLTAVSSAAGGSTPIWLLLAFVVLREVLRMAKDRVGPQWVKNGAMDQIIENFTSRLAEENATATHNVEFISALADIKVETGKISVLMDSLLARHAQYQEGWPTMVNQMAGCSEKMDAHARALDSQSEHLADQGRVMQAIARELNNTRSCPYTPADARTISEELKRKRALDAHTRAEDLGVDLEGSA